MLLNRSGWRLLLVCPILGAGPAAAAVAAPQTPFHIAAAPTSEALIDLALQARISILNTEICRGRSPAVNGRLSIEQALKALVRDSQCGFEFVDPRAVRMVRASPAVQPAPRGRAQQPSAEPALSELVVTATKSEAAIDEIGGSVSVVSGERVSALGASDASDLIGLLSGVSTTNLGPGRDKL
ncbi:MAG: iron complex outerrane recepter protein, partial [Mucilaginibacter sp.]|nr:iron complex outerrane recepter protein [Mucilaginibacter sp.]